MNGNKDWEQTVMDNARFINLKQIIKTSGYHTLKIWMIDPGVVIEKIVMDTGGVRASYLGPPESSKYILMKCICDMTIKLIYPYTSFKNLKKNYLQSVAYSKISL